MAKQLKTVADGANAERRAIRAKVKRMVKQTIDPFDLNLLLEWINERDKRYNAKPGGLGKK